MNNTFSSRTTYKYNQSGALKPLANPEENMKGIH